MGRPQRTNAEYFTHSANFRNDRRIKSIRARFGVAGYGLVLMLMEALTDAENIQISTDEIELELLAGDLGVSVTEIDNLLQVAEKIGLFARLETGFFTCPDLMKSLQPVFDKRNRAKTTFQDKQKNISVTETNDSVTENTQSRVKKSRVKDTKVSSKKSSGADAPADKEYTLTHKIGLAIRELSPEYYWDGKDAKSAQELIDKLKNSYRVTRKAEPTDEQIIDSLKTLIQKSQSLAPYFHFNGMATLNEKYNATVTEIHKMSQGGRNGKESYANMNGHVINELT